MEVTVVTSENNSISDEELDSLLSASDEDDEFKTEFVDERMEVVTRARLSLILI